VSFKSHVYPSLVYVQTMKFFVLFVLVAAATANKVIRYDGYRVLEVGPLKDEAEATLIRNLADEDTRLRQVILYNDHISKLSPVSLAVAPDVFDRVQQVLDENGIHFVIVENDLQKQFDATIEESVSKINVQRRSDTVQS